MATILMHGNMGTGELKESKVTQLASGGAKI